MQGNDSRVIERRVINSKNVSLALVSGCLIAILFLLSILVFSFDFPQIIIMILSLGVFYAVVLFFLLEPIRIIERKSVEYKEIDRPVVREVIVEKPIIKEVYVDRPYIVEEKKKKLEIPRYEFCGSSQTKVYHTRNCRLGKSIKQKFKLSNNSKQYFVKYGFRACKLCLKK